MDISEETAADLEAVAMKTPEVVPVVACAVKVAQSAVSEEFIVLLARMLDKFKSRFLVHWRALPIDVKKFAPQLSDFVTVTGDTDDIDTKVPLLKARLKTLESAPSAMKNETGRAVAMLKDQIKGAQSESADNNALYFRKADFKKQITDRLVRFTGSDPAHAATAANEVVLNTGLNYKAYLKSAVDELECLLGGVDVR